MSTKEIDRGELIRRVREKRLKQSKAAAMLGLSVRQVKRLCRRFKVDGLSGLASRQRGRPSNRKFAAELNAKVVALVSEMYADFGPKLAHEELVEVHGIRVGRFAAEQRVRRKKHNHVSIRRRRERQLLELQTQAELNRQAIGVGGEDPLSIVDGSAGLRVVGARWSAGSAPAAQDQARAG